MRKEADDIPADECWDLLRSVSVGRMALSMGAVPAILPVQYYVDGEALAACLGHYSVPRGAINNVVVAFAADELESNGKSGWTVQVHGTVSPFTPLGVPVDCGQPTAGQIVRIAPVVVTGHRIHLCPFVQFHRSSNP